MRIKATLNLTKTLVSITISTIAKTLKRRSKEREKKILNGEIPQGDVLDTCYEVQPFPRHCKTQTRRRSSGAVSIWGRNNPKNFKLRRGIPYQLIQ